MVLGYPNPNPNHDFFKITLTQAHFLRPNQVFSAQKSWSLSDLTRVCTTMPKYLNPNLVDQTRTALCLKQIQRLEARGTKRQNQGETNQKARESQGVGPRLEKARGVKQIQRLDKARGLKQIQIEKTRVKQI